MALILPPCHRAFLSPATSPALTSSSPFSSPTSHCIHGCRCSAASPANFSPSSISLHRRRNRDALRFLCRSSNRLSGGDADQFVQASLLIPETLRHYHLWKHGLVEETKWQAPRESFHAKGVEMHSRIGSSIGPYFFRRFHNPTIFLKLACEGQLLLPISVDEVAIHKLIESSGGVHSKECPDQYEFIKSLILTLGYEVKMVRVTGRVVNTYLSSIHLGKPAESFHIGIDARPSDAIVMAKRFKAPIYVDRQIVIGDAIQVSYGTWRTRGTKTVYDVSLDSATEGPDLISQEFDLVKKINLAVLEERYEDAAIWRVKLSEFRMQS